MDVHKNARTLPHVRMLIVERLTAGWSVTTVAAAAGVTPKTIRKWRDRHAAKGEPRLIDRSSRPHLSPARLNAANEDAIETLRRQRLSRARWITVDDTAARHARKDGVTTR